jgi:extradiol dioxygenase family protein
MTAARFHLSFCVSDLEATRRFYRGLLGCSEGRSSASSVDFSFWGHQLTCHLAPARVRVGSAEGLDGNHFGAILPHDEFQRVAACLQAANVHFIKPPAGTELGTAAEQWRMVFTDPSGNAIELKVYRDESKIFQA